MNILLSVVVVDKFFCIIKNWKFGVFYYRVWILEISCVEDIGK